MSDDVFAAMGIAGFGKTLNKRQLDPHRFDKNKRAEVRRAPSCFPNIMLTYEIDKNSRSEG